MELGKLQMTAADVRVWGRLAEFAALPLTFGVIEMVFVGHDEFPRLQRQL
jgi:hypothetical protein